MKKKAMALVLASLMAAGILAGCGGDSKTTKEDGKKEGGKPYEGVTLTMWMAGAEYNEGTKAVMEKATEALGMEFEVEINPGGAEGDNIIKTKCASGDLPDIVNWNSGSKFKGLNPKEYFLDLSEQKFAEKFDDVFKESVSQDGKLLGAPYTTTQAGAVVYWKPDYEELGLKVPTTWDEFIKNCDALEAAGKTSMYMSGGDTWTTQVLFLGDNYNVLAGVETFAEDFTAGKAKFATTPSALASWEKYEDLVGRYNEDNTAAKYEDGIEAIGTGQATHWIILTQVIPQMVTNHPENADKIGVFGVPGDKAEDAGLTVWEPNSWYVSKDAQNQDAALAFLDFWYQEDMMDLFIETYGANGPSCIKGYTLPEKVAPAIREDMQKYFDDGKTAPALEYLSDVKGATCEQITTSVSLGQIKGTEAAKMYDDDCEKSAVQLGLDW